MPAIGRVVVTSPDSATGPSGSSTTLTATTSLSETSPQPTVVHLISLFSPLRFHEHHGERPLGSDDVFATFR